MDIKSTLDALNVDLFYEVTERTFLSPFFTFWIPVIAVCQNNRHFFNVSAIFFILVTIRSFIRWSSQAWINRRWTTTPIDWSEQIVLVTGGSDGLGRVLVETLVLKNVTVVVLDIKPFDDNPHQEGEDGDVAFYHCDISDPAMVESVATKIKKEVGSPTILINNAGVVVGRKIVDLTPEDIHRTFGVNVLSHFYLLKAFLPHMIERKIGHIVTISSVLGSIGVAQASDYCASKAASSALHHSLRQELNSKYAAHGIRTTLVCPGKMMTKMFDKIPPQNKFIFPEIAPHDLAKKIIQSIDNRDSIEIFVPFYSSWAWVLRIVPTWALDFAHWVAQSHHAMDQF